MSTAELEDALLFEREKLVMMRQEMYALKKALKEAEALAELRLAALDARSGMRPYERKIPSQKGMRE